MSNECGWLPVLTTNEESIFIENVHKASLFTDGSLNLGICVLHSFDMLRGGFNWIFFGFIIDIVLEWKPSWIKLLGDARLEVCVLYASCVMPQGVCVSVSCLELCVCMCVYAVVPAHLPRGAWESAAFRGLY